MSIGQQADSPTQTIDAYLGELLAALRGPARWRRRVLIETEDGMRANLTAGEITESDVVRQWGPVRLIAAEFNAAARQLRARHMALRIVQLMLPAILGWGFVVAMNPHPWPQEPALVAWLVPTLFASVVSSATGAGWLIRSAATRTVDPAAVVCACLGVGTGTVSVVVLLTYRLVAGRGPTFWPAALIAGALTIALIAVVLGDARHLRRSAFRAARG